MALYRFDPLRGRLSVVSTVEVPADAGRNAALVRLLAAVNSRLVGRRIEAVGESTEGLQEVLVLDLQDVGGSAEGTGWYEAFQGSAGGTATQAFLVATFLQQKYRGEWYGGDECLCRDGPVLETFETAYRWSPEQGRFVAME
jgi:hypothetical protein